MIKVGVIGTGFGVKVHVPGWQKIPGVKVTALAGTKKDDLQKKAGAFGIPATYTDWKELVRDANVDIVSIATPPHLHMAIIKEALHLGKPVLCEKPLSVTAKEAATIASLEKKFGGVCATDFELRYLPAFKKAKEILTKNTIGGLRSVVITLSTGGRARSDSPVNWSCFTKFGGGVLPNYGAHVIDYIEWLFGDIASVSAELVVTKKIKTVLKPDAEDAAFVLFKLVDGTPITLSITNVVYGGQGHRIDIYGENGSLALINPNVFDFARGFDLTHVDAREKTKKFAFKDEFADYPDGRLAPFVALARDFVKHLKAKQYFTPSLATGARAQKIIAAAQISNKEKKWISTR